MVIMALDHTRDYFHAGSYLFNPADPERSTLAIFFTRFVTHFCAPAFSFLAGVSAYLYGRKKTANELSQFLLKRGLWLVFIELTLVNFAWFFDPEFHSPTLQVIWALGISMLCLAAISRLQKVWILVFSVLLIAGHNLLDFYNSSSLAVWTFIHSPNAVAISKHTYVFVAYPLVPWIAVMSLGFYFGNFYDIKWQPAQRKKIFNIIGISAILLFVLLRFTAFYGDPHPFYFLNNYKADIIHFLNPQKYPPSLLYLLMTLGFSFLFLANTEKLKGKLVAFFSTFGRVPFFYYILHIYFIHLAAMLMAQLTGYGWRSMVLYTWVSQAPALQGFGVSLVKVYLIWIAIILALYPFCKMFDRYKQNHKAQWFLSYL